MSLQVQTPPLLLLLLLISTSHSFQFTTQQQQQCGTKHKLTDSDSTQSLLSSDFVVLLSIKSSLKDLPGSNFFSTWEPISNPCTTFSGVTCSATEADSAFLRVTSLSLGTGLADSPGLTGTFPTSISNLTSLTEFILFSGRVSGAIPTDMPTSLQFLSITNNLISGPIPDCVTELQDLATLDLGHNRLSGPIPSRLLSLPNLKVVILASNGYLSGEIPAVESPLLHLDLRGNSFSGKLPALPPTLRYLSVSSNYMSGGITGLGGLKNLSFLDLGMNGFNGPIPASLFSPSVPLLLLQRNYFSGRMPPEPEVSPAYTPAGGWTVDLSHNLLGGEVSAALAGAESVYINNNRFVGVVPSVYSMSVFAGTMKNFYAQHNFLTGFDFPLPPGSDTLPISVSVCLAYNCMAPPPIGPTVCPANAGNDVPRPAEQCPKFNGSAAGTPTARWSEP